MYRFLAVAAVVYLVYSMFVSNEIGAWIWLQLNTGLSWATASLRFL